MTSLFENLDKSNPQIQETQLINQYRKSVRIATKVLEDKFKEYIRAPESHPLYADEWAAFWSKRYKNISEKGKDPNTYDYKDEWQDFWKSRMIMLCVQQKLLKMIEIRQEMNLSEEFVSKINMRTFPKRKRRNKNKCKKLSALNQQQSNLQCKKRNTSDNAYKLDSKSDSVTSYDNKSCLQSSGLSNTPSCTTTTQLTAPLFFTKHQQLNGEETQNSEDIENLTGEDLKFLLQNFFELTDEEQNDLIQYLKDIKTIDCDRFDELRKFIVNEIAKVETEEQKIEVFKSETEDLQDINGNKCNTIHKAEPISVMEYNNHTVPIVSVQNIQQFSIPRQVTQQSFHNQPMIFWNPPTQWPTQFFQPINPYRFPEIYIQHKNLERPNIIQLTGKSTKQPKH